MSKRELFNLVASSKIPKDQAPTRNGLDSSGSQINRKGDQKEFRQVKLISGSFPRSNRTLHNQRKPPPSASKPLNKRKHFHEKLIE